MLNIQQQLELFKTRIPEANFKIWDRNKRYIRFFSEKELIGSIDYFTFEDPIVTVESFERRYIMTLKIANIFYKLLNTIKDIKSGLINVDKNNKILIRLS